ncbi:hypothetical protein BBR47_08340 [Brevibacillus brevis NBRC 100599]|uniref:Uncharacterized protein n=1 Tax=Brevibacillus brevis (strain 47 / JCM 6285 / NBRC 100599) TaxID=358681 RepID=C0Z4T4_BREBN|nr:hypothetical protein BBR47_08340 [Brevibacillus brevis NBRC 100599]
MKKAEELKTCRFFVFHMLVPSCSEGKKCISSLRFGLRPAKGIDWPLRNE